MLEPLRVDWVYRQRGSLASLELTEDFLEQAVQESVQLTTRQSPDSAASEGAKSDVDQAAYEVPKLTLKSYRFIRGAPREEISAIEFHPQRENFDGVPVNECTQCLLVEAVGIELIAACKTLDHRLPDRGARHFIVTRYWCRQESVSDDGSYLFGTTPKKFLRRQVGYEAFTCPATDDVPEES
jgi:hypothetical protein